MFFAYFLAFLAVVSFRIFRGALNRKAHTKHGYCVLGPLGNLSLALRAFLMQSNLSVENGLFRLNEAEIGLSYAVEKGLLRLNFFLLRIPTGGSSRKTRLFRLDPPVEKLSRKRFTRVF